MQPELPWNVAGIEPEAREAARASARREGLSLGEWLTRRILRGLAETEPAKEEWWLPDSTAARAPDEKHHFSRGSADTLARVSHSESEIQESYGRIEDRLKSLPRPAEQREHDEHKHATSNATAEITLATREQARAVDQLAARVVRLDGRVTRIEGKTAADGARGDETIKALQERLARLGSQVSQTASRSAAQAAQLASAIEAVAGKFSQSRSEVQNLRHAFDDRVAALGGNIGSIDAKLFEFREETERQLLAVEERLAATETTTERVEADRDSMARLGGSLEALTRRFETNGTEHFDSIGRLESRMNRIETSNGEGLIDKRLHAIEQALAEMAQSIDKHALEKADASEAIQSELRNLASRIDAAERIHEPPIAPPQDTDSRVPIFDLPPFPEKPLAASAPPPANATMASSLHDPRASSQDFSAGTPRENAAQQPDTTGADSLVAAALRTARAVSSAQAQERNAPFSWIDATGLQQAKKDSNTRLVLLGGLGLLVLSAVGAGLYLSNNFAQTTKTPQTTLSAPHNATIATRPKPERMQPAQHVLQTISVPAADVRTTSTAAAPKPASSHRTEMSPTRVPEPARLSPRAASAPTAQTAAAQAKPVTTQGRVAALANAGNAKAEEVLGLEYLDGDGVAINEAEGAKWLERAAARGEGVAAYRLGTLYERGHGVPADHARAAQWYAAAAKAGNRKAMHNLAVAYAQGTGVRKDLSLAAEWFLRAATLGLADSQFNLAVLYERGMGVQQSLTEAYKWYAIAAAHGDPESKARMEAIASQIGAADKAAAEKAAADFQPAPVDGVANSPPIAASLVGG